MFVAPTCTEDRLAPQGRHVLGPLITGRFEDVFFVMDNLELAKAVQIFLPKRSEPRRGDMFVAPTCTEDRLAP